MKIKTTFVFVLGIFSVFIFSFPCFSQGKINAYQVEQDGYFVHPVVTSAGIVVSDNAAGNIYLVLEKEIQTLVSSPGCGRYYTVSPDKTKIGFKKINADGMQIPAVFDLQTMKISELSNPADLCGQVSFSNNGKTAFTIGNDLYVTNNGSVESFPLGVYSNISPISPDGNSVVFNKDDDQLYILDLTSGVIKKITDDQFGYAFPQWSPDGKKIVYSSLPGELKVWDKVTENTYSIGAGENASWSDDSKYLFFDVVSSENFEFIGSEIFVAKADGTGMKQLTNTPDINEMFPVPVNGNSILFSTYEKRSVVSSEIDLSNSALKITDTLFCSLQPIAITEGVSGNFSQKSIKAITMVPGDVPYVHQRWDTPDWHAGSGSCAPTTAIMALGYYNRLPHWDIICASNPTSHISHYGSYVADKYRFNEIFYDTYADAYGTDAYGGYGYMWGLGSPNSYMAEYIQNHDVNSVHSTTTTFDEVTAEIDNGYPFPICNLLSTAGHLTLTVGYVNGQHTLIFNDPYGDKNDGSWGDLNNGKDSYYDWPGYNNGYQNLNTMAWTVTSESSEPVYNDTIIDDVYYNHGFYMYNQDPSHMQYFHDMATGGYNNHFWFTYTSASTTIDTCYVTWTPNLTTNGDYEISAYIPTTNASATAARYEVYYNGGSQTVIVNQAPLYGEWISLGTFPFLAGSSGYVKLGDGTGTASQKIAFDAMKWVGVSQPAALASFNSSVTSVCEGNAVQFTNTSTNATTYNWTFDGGTQATSTDADPLVMYPNSGTYTVSLDANGPGGNNTLTMTNYIAVDPPATAGFSVSNTTVYLPTASVTFTNSSSDATTYDWDFGDGASSTQQDPVHTYSAAGDFIVIMVAYNLQCGNDTTTDTIHVLNPPPVAGFSATSTSVCEGESIQFTNSSANATSYSWTFTGGTPSTSILSNPLIAYANVGTYTVELVVTGPGGSNTLTMTNYITVNPSATAGFSSSNTTVYLPAASVTFTNSSSDATTYDWDFGDGASSTQQDPVHTYTAAGDFIVTLVAFNLQCGNDTITDTIHVLNPPPVAGFSATSTSVCEGESVQFTNSSANATSYSWTFTGGTPSTSILSNPLIAYVNAGTYPVELVVSGDGGIDTLNIQNYITVNPLADAQFSANETTVYLPSADVIFTNASLNATSWLWDFGDGTTSTDQNPWHTYTAAGLYTVSLIAYNTLCGNDTITITDYILVDISTAIDNENSNAYNILISPNPASSDFTISYELTQNYYVEIIMYDMVGNKICVLQKTQQTAGKHELSAGTEQLILADGIYLIKFSFGDNLFRKKLVFQR